MEDETIHRSKKKKKEGKKTIIAIYVQLNLYLRTKLVKNGCTYCEKYLNEGMDSHRLTCDVVQLVNDLPKKIQKFDKPLELHVKGFNWSMAVPKNSKTS
jgi:hypothetical protein